MLMTKTPLFAAAALLFATPAIAQTAPAPAPASEAAAPTAAAPAPVDPARLAAARPVVAKLFPDGTYRRIFGGAFRGMMNRMTGGVGHMPLREIAQVGGMTTDQANKLGNTTLAEVEAIIDPHWQQRMDATMDAVMDGMSDLMSQYEPQMRDALAHAYAANFTVAQLDDLDRYFSTPTGAAYAAKSMVIYMDPSMMQQMQTMMPDMLKKMPEIFAAVGKKTADLPQPRKITDLSPAERSKLASLLNVKVADLQDPKPQP